MMPVKDFFDALLEQGYVYRYFEDRFAELEGGGHPYPSPIRRVKTKDGTMVEEIIQPLLDQIVISNKQASVLRRLAAAYPNFFKVQMKIFHLARLGELDPQLTELVKSTCTQAEWKLGHLDSGYEDIHPFVRLDAVLVDDDFIVMDINTTRPAGVGDLIAYEKAVGRDLRPGLRSFAIGCKFSREVRRCLDQWAGSHHLPGESLALSIAIKETDGDFRNFENLKKKLLASGLNAKLIDPQELKNNSQYLAVIRGRIKEGHPDFSLLADGYPDKYCLLSPLYRRFLGNKIWMYAFRIPPFKEMFQEVLQDDYKLFDKLIVETGIQSDGLVYFPDYKLPPSELNRKEWVIKDPASSSGRRMYMGRKTTRNQWQQIVNQTANGTVWQRFYRRHYNFTVADAWGEPIVDRFYAKYGIYIFGKQLGGLELHARKSSLVHGARDTYMNSVYYQE